MHYRIVKNTKNIKLSPLSPLCVVSTQHICEIVKKALSAAHSTRMPCYILSHHVIPVKLVFLSIINDLHINIHIKKPENHTY